MPFLEHSLWPLVLPPILIFGARVLDVSLGTVRIALISRGMRRTAPLVGFLETLVWLLALGAVVRHLDRPLNVLAYAGGFAAGTWAGLLLEERLALGLYAVQIITKRDATDLSEDLGARDFGVTSVSGRGLQGRVRLIHSVIERKEYPRLVELVRRFHPQAFVTVSDVRMASAGHLPAPSGSGLRLLEFLGKK